MTPHWHDPTDTLDGSPWHTLRHDDGRAVSRKLVIALDGLFVLILVIIAFAVHW
jgi:hypothetical protein